MRRVNAVTLLFAVGACGTVDVNYGPASNAPDAAEHVDQRDDAAAGGADAGSDTSPDAAALAHCDCPAGDTCCVPPSAPPFCVAAGDTTMCAAANGLGLSCARGENGRECCLASDGRSSHMATSCDGGAQLCGDPGECSAGTCVPFTCRTAQLSICSNQTPVCPP